ncbi:MAG: HD domain-containing protein [Caldilinea sp.]|nr:HD domain-containing protein [Caldilinea sp.]MDW8441030.1 HD domain-containing protein [Caldilineaceae bacterium]
MHEPNTPPIPALLSILEHACVLKRLPRTGWLLNGVVPCESIADHTTGVALLTLALADALNADWEAQGLERPLEVGRALTLAVLHDLAESRVTDLPKSSATLLGTEVKRRAESEAFSMILGTLPAANDYMTLWREYVEEASPEARLVHDADALEMVHQALLYERAGHRTLDEFWQGHRWHYPLCEQVFDILRNARS